MSLEGNVVLITGATGSLGQAVVPAFTEAGARVIAAARGTASGPMERRTLVAADVTDEADVRRLVEDVIQTEGRLDALINLVGGFAPGRVWETDLSLWQRMMTMNLTSAFLLSKAVLPHMLERRSGRIVHVAAKAAADPFPGAAAYIAAKAGLAALVRALSLELTGTGVTVNAVLPSTIDTPANRKNMPDADPAAWVKPASIARLLVFLSSEDSGQVNGALIPVG